MFGAVVNQAPGAGAVELDHKVVVFGGLWVVRDGNVGDPHLVHLPRVATGAKETGGVGLGVGVLVVRNEEWGGPP